MKIFFISCKNTTYFDPPDFPFLIGKIKEASVKEEGDINPSDIDPDTDYLGEKEVLAASAPIVTEPKSFEEGAPLMDLSLEIDSVVLPESATELGSPGSIDVIITNKGDATIDGTININLFASSDKKINTRVLPLTGKEVQDGLLTTLEGADLSGLEPGDSKTVTIEYDNITSFVPPGSQFLIAEIEGDSLGEAQDVVEENNSDDMLVSLPGTDVVLDWQTVGANLTTNQFLFDELPGVGAAPPQGTRNGALLSASIFNTFAGVTGEFDPYAIDLDAIEMSPEGVSVEAAIAGAAATVLSEVYPEQEDIINGQMDLSLEEIQDDPAAEMLGLAYGSLVAKELLDLREDEFASFEDPFFWTPDDNGGGVAVGAQYVDTAIPWAIESSEAIIDLISPDAPDSPEFLADLQTVAALGGAEDIEITKILRTDDQSEIAKFFFVDRGDSYKPNKHLNHIAQEISIDQGFDLKDNVELFFKLNLALADAVIVTWDAKYNEQYPRPSQPINDLIDPEWKAFLEEPGFLDWISGHSTMEYAAQAVFEEQFGEIGTFGVVSPDTPGIEREFDSFGELADEFSLSRVFAGVHTIDGAFTDPDVAGTAIGEEVLDSDSRLPEILIHRKVKQIHLRRFVVKKIEKFAGWILYNTLPNSYKEEAMYQFTEDSKLPNHSFLKDLVSYFVGGIEYRFKKIVRGFVSTVIKFLKSSSYFLRTKLWRLFLLGIIPVNRLIPNYPYSKLNEYVYWR